jgi:hypothetical protein
VKKTLIIVAVCVLIYVGVVGLQTRTPSGAGGPVHNDGGVTAAVQNQASNVQVEGEGVVIKELPDDLQGSRHQRILLRLASGGTLLVAHNIDLAPRVDGIREGDTVRFYGVFEWNEKGGVVHWTHHDPAGQHVSGWLKHKGRTFQ